MSEEIKDILEHLSTTQKINNGWTSFSDKECKLLYDYITNLQQENIYLREKIKLLQSVIKEVREYITSYESIETIQQFDHNKNNKDLDYPTINEMARRYMIVHDKTLKILDKGERK